MERKTLKRVIYEKDPPIARIILNHPEKANVQDELMVWDVDNCLSEAEQDWDIKVVVLKANGRGFCSGHPVRPMPGNQTIYPSSAGKPNGWKPIGELFLWPVLHLWEFQKPAIAQVHGYCIGGGTYFGLFTDLTICSEDAYFQMPLVQGLGLPGGSTMIEPWLFMNWKRAAKYLYTAQTLSAQEALQYGLVNDVVPRDKLEETVEETARVIAQAPISTLLTTKALLKRAWEIMGMRVHLQSSHDLHILTGRSADVQKMREESGVLAQETRKYPRDLAAEHAAKASQQSR
jgi:enoyl-CoA hydratase